MMTLTKKQVVVGDRAGAIAAARYALGEADAPRHFDGPEGDEAHHRRGNTMWLGSEAGLGVLGLQPGQRVEARHLASAMEGRHVADRKVRVRKHGSIDALDEEGRPRLDEQGRPLKEKVVNNYELCFSVPKSVSILWALAGPELKARIEQVMFEAANGALEHLIATRRLVRGGKDAEGNREPDRLARGFVAAVSLHATARVADGERVPMPQLHLHIDLVGVVDEKGNLRTPESTALFKNSTMRLLGALARLHVAEAVRAMGFGIEGGTGKGERYFRVIGIAEELCERMSGRARDVLAWAGEIEAKKGTELSARERARGAAATRPEKAEVDPEEAKEVWEELGDEFALDRGGIEELGERTYPEPDREALREVLRRRVVEQVRAEGPTVSLGALESIAAEFAPRGLTLAETFGVLGQMQARGELIALEGDLITTGEIREREVYVRDVFLAAQAEPGEPVSAEALQAGIEAAELSLGGHELYPEQRRAVERLAAGEGWSILTGKAGTGKGPVLEALAAAHRHDDWKVIATAVDGATTQRLAKQIRSEAHTLESLLRSYKSGELEITHRSLIVIEEASKLGLWQREELARIRALTQARFLEVGDVGQIGAIECPGMFEALIDAAGEERVVRLEEVRRHRDPDDPDRAHPWMGEMLDHLYGKDADGHAAVKVLRREGAITLHDTRREAMVGLVDRWEQHRLTHQTPAERTVLVVHGTNEEVDAVNVLAQQRRLRANQLGAEGVPAADRDYELRVGDVVMMREAAYRPEPELGADPFERPARIENGTMGIVSAADRSTGVVRVRFQDPAGGEREADVDLHELAERHADPLREPGERVPSLRLAYAWHPFPLQGGTWEYVGALWGHQSQGREETYSAAARMRFWLDVHTDRETIGFERNVAAYFRELGKKVGASRNKQASIASEPDTDVHLGKVPKAFGPTLQPEPADPAAEAELPLLWDPEETLADQARALGKAHLGKLHRRADRLAAQVAALEDEQLLELHDAGRRAFAELDRPAAMEAERLRAGRRKRQAEIERLQARRTALEEQAAEAKGLRGARRRKELGQAAAVLSTTIEKETEKLETLRTREAQLREEGHHPEEWVEEHGERFAAALAAERALTARVAELRPVSPEVDPLEAVVEAGPGVEL